MKKLLFAFLLTAIPPLNAAERIFVSTDRSVYIAGENLFCSLFCMETDTMQPSELSAVAYLEIASEESTATTAKIALQRGRGAGMVPLPTTIPTGNYIIYAYTAAGGTQDCLAGSKVISVFNTTSKARSNVQVVSDEEYAAKIPADVSDGLSIFVMGQARCGKDFEIALSQTLGNNASISFSVFRTDDIDLPENGGIRAFANTLQQKGDNERTPAIAEYEGEIIKARVKGGKASTAILSSAGSPTDVYIGKPDTEGNVLFYTNNIYGDRELVCSVDSPDAYLSISDPFMHPAVGSIPDLKIAPTLFSSLVARKTAASQVQADTLLIPLPKRKDNLTESLPQTHYHLDDYTRFHSLSEIFVEIVHELSLGKSHGKDILRLGFKDPTTGRYFLRENILVMLDGVILPEIAPLKKMEATLFKDIDIYYGPFAMGGVSFNGIVNFVTKQNYVKVIDFPAGVSVVDFKGVCAPVAYLGTPPETGQDNRVLLYWHPDVAITKEETLRFSLKAPSNPGHFAAMGEGLTGDGVPIYAVWTFDVL